jgi:hypothetical protein
MSLQSSEDYLIGCCLLDEGVTIDRAKTAGLRPHHLEHRAAIFSHLLQLREEGVPIGLDTLAPRLNGQANLQDLMALENAAPTSAHVGHHIGLLLREATKRAEILKAKARIEELERGEGLPEASDLRSRLLGKRVKAAAPPPEPVTRLFLADKPICTAGNITTLTSKAKTGKTAATGAATAAIICAASGTSAIADTFKFRAANPNGHAVIIIDTEQSPYDAYQCYRRSLDRAGQQEDPPWLHHYSLVGANAAELHEALDLALEIACEAHQEIFLVILDGVADFVNSVNDEAESNQFEKWLRSRTVTYNCPVICVIHSNEGDKAGLDSRGHLGKQLIRKAESNLLLKKEGEVTTITSDKQRKAPITEQDGVAFRWSDEAGRHISCAGTSEGRPKGGRPKRATLHTFSSVIPKTAKAAQTRATIYKYANELFPISETAFREILGESCQTGELCRITAPHGFLYHFPEIPAPSGV